MKILLGVAYGIVFTAALAMIGEWWLSAVVGIIHNEWIRSLPTLGFWGAVKIVAICTLGIAVGRARARIRQQLSKGGRQIQQPILLQE